MTTVALVSAIASLVLTQGAAGGAKALPSPTVAPAVAPAEPVYVSPTDAFGPDLKAWLEATKLHDSDAATAALKRLQSRRAERSLFSVDDVAGAMVGRAETQAGEGQSAESLAALQAAIKFAPDSAALQVRKAAAEDRSGEAMDAFDLAEANPFESGRLSAARLLGLLAIGGFFAMGFSLSLLVRYGAVFSHDVAEGLSPGLKPLSLFMAVLFIALPLAGFMGWGYLPFWWMALFFIFESRSEKTVSVVVLIALGLSSLALPVIAHQRSMDAASGVRRLYEVVAGGASAEGEAIVRQRAAADTSNDDWALFSASMLRRAGRMDEAASALAARADGDVRFAHNAAALEFNKTNYLAAEGGISKAAESASQPLEKATALYNYSLVKANLLDFAGSKELRKKADAIAPAPIARYDRLLAFDREGSLLQAPPDIVPNSSRLVDPVLPKLVLSVDNAVSRLAVVALGLLIFVPLIVKFRGSQSFSKQCPKCGTTFCWLCQTRSTSQDVCSQCHHLFVVKRGIPPAARAAKNREITRHVTTRALLHRVSSLLAPGAGHLSVGHFVFGLPVLLVWAICLGALVTVHFLAPGLVTTSPVASTIKLVCLTLGALTYLAAQVVKPKAHVVAPAPRRPRPGQEAEA